MLMHHASVVPESEEKHSDTTHQHIQMLKEQLEKPIHDYDDLTSVKAIGSNLGEELPTNLQIGSKLAQDRDAATTNAHMTDDPFSIRVTDISPINREGVKSILTTKENEDDADLATNQHPIDLQVQKQTTPSQLSHQLNIMQQRVTPQSLAMQHQSAIPMPTTQTNGKK